MASHNYALINTLVNEVVNTIVLDTDGEDIIEPGPQDLGKGTPHAHWRPPQNHIARIYTGVVEIGYSFDPVNLTYTKPVVKEPTAG